MTNNKTDRKVLIANMWSLPEYNWIKNITRIGDNVEVIAERDFSNGNKTVSRKLQRAIIPSETVDFAMRSCFCELDAVRSLITFWDSANDRNGGYVLLWEDVNDEAKNL